MNKEEQLRIYSAYLPYGLQISTDDEGEDWVETSNMGTLIYSLTYEEGFDRFVARDETRKVNLGVGHQRQMFEKLYEWKLNVFQLPEDQYINKATLNHELQ